MAKIINTGIESVPLQLLKPHPRNVNQGDFGAIQESVETNGFYGTIVANKRTGHILAGNHRYAVAKAMHYTDVPVAWVDVDDEQELRILIADNRTTRLGIDNEASLTELLAELAATPTGLTGTGFDGDDLDALISSVTGADKTELLTDPDEVPEDVPTRCNPGDLWQLGDHRLLCGDSTKAEDVKRLMNGDKVDMIFTDPPYGQIAQEWDRDWNMEWKAFINDVTDGIVCVFCNQPFGTIVMNTMVQVMDFWFEGIWVKDQGTPFRNQGFLQNHENIFVFRPKGRQVKDLITNPDRARLEGEPYKFKSRAGVSQVTGAFVPEGHRESDGGRHPTTAMKFNRPGSGYSSDKWGHPTQKPIELIAKYLQFGSIESCIDFFLGSGSTLMASEQIGRRCYGLEITPKYCDVIIERWERATGKTAVLLEAGNGTTE